MAKDDERVVRFMSLFSRLREMNDDPETLESDAATDQGLRDHCLKLDWVATLLKAEEDRHPQLFSAPVNPAFVEFWREYEERYAKPIAGVFLSSLGFDLELPQGSRTDDPLNVKWSNQDADARDLAAALSQTMSLVQNVMVEDDLTYDDEQLWTITQGIEAWNLLHDKILVDLRGILRRRALVPFVLVPRHVANKYSLFETRGKSAARLSLFVHLDQAHLAFMIGAFLPCLAMMRSLLEVILRKHYSKHEGELHKLIDDARGLPKGISKIALRQLSRLANDVLHFDEASQRIPDDIERDLTRYFYLLRSLIEGAPLV